jgi:hypothetical protein
MSFDTITQIYPVFRLGLGTSYIFGAHFTPINVKNELSNNKLLTNAESRYIISQMQHLGYRKIANLNKHRVCQFS